MTSQDSLLTPGTVSGGHNPIDRLLAEVVDVGLCTHCGTCVGLTGGALEMSSTPWGPIPRRTPGVGWRAEDAILDACPGRAVGYPDLCRHVFGQVPTNWLTGCYRSLYVGFSRSPHIRERGASGGVITQTLIYLLEKGLIDGAVVVRLGEPKPWLAHPMIARTVEDIQAASQSVYAPVPVNVILSSLETFSGRLAYVGLPDQVASIRRLQQVGHPSVRNIDYVIGPYVGTNLYFGAVESYMRSNHIKTLDDIVELRYRAGEWPGKLRIRTRDGKVVEAEKFYYNYLIPFYVTRSTLYSVDFTNELTDISVGDAWHPRYEAEGLGFSIVISRSEKGEDLLHAMEAENLLELDSISLDDALSMHGHMLDFKKRGSFIRIAWRRALGKPAPHYGYRPRSIALSRQMVEVVISLLFLLCSTSVARRLIEVVPLSILGPAFNRLRLAWKEMSRPTKRRGIQSMEWELVDMQRTRLSGGHPK